jgi:hypothetical protein
MLAEGGSCVIENSSDLVLSGSVTLAGEGIVGQFSEINLDRFSLSVAAGAVAEISKTGMIFSSGSFEVDSGGSVTLEDCTGTISSPTVADAVMIVHSSPQLTLEGNSDMGGGQASIDLSGVGLALASLTVQASATLSITEATGSIASMTISGGGSITIDPSQLLLSGPISLAGADAQVDLSQKVFDGVSVSVSGGASLTIAGSTGTVEGLAVQDSTMSVQSSPELTFGGAAAAGGEATHVDWSTIKLSLASLTVESNAAFFIVTCSGSVTDLTVTDASATMDDSALVLSGSVTLSGMASQMELSQKVFDGVSVSISNSASLGITTCSGSVIGLTVLDASATLDDPEDRIKISGSMELSGASSQLELEGKTFDRVAFSVVDGASLHISGGTLNGSTVNVVSGTAIVDGACMLKNTPVTVSGRSKQMGTLTIMRSEIQSDSSSPALVVESGGMATVTAVVFQSLGGEMTVASVSEGGQLLVAESQLVHQRKQLPTGNNEVVNSDPFPCDGVVTTCTEVHEGSVVVEGPSVINMAAPLVCNVKTGECLSDRCSDAILASRVEYQGTSGFCRGAKGGGQEVNGRVRCLSRGSGGRDVDNEDACAVACTELKNCVGYGYGAYTRDEVTTYACDQGHGDRCFLYGPGLNTGLTPYAEPVTTTEWQGYTQQNTQIGAGAGQCTYHECINSVCKKALVDDPHCGMGGSCISPHGTCACRKGYTGDSCETHSCCTSNYHCYYTDRGYQRRDSGAWCDENRPGWDDDCDRSC